MIAAIAIRNLLLGLMVLRGERLFGRAHAAAIEASFDAREGGANGGHDEAAY